VDEMKSIFKALKSHKIKYTINTDGPEMLVTNLRKEIGFLLSNKVYDESDAFEANRQAFAASFLK